MRPKSVFILLVHLCLLGCVSSPVPEVRTNLIVTRAGDEVNIQWQSTAGQTYTVLYADRISSGARWQVLPGGVGIKGTGGLIKLSDHPPAGRPRYYDLHVDYAK